MLQCQELREWQPSASLHINVRNGGIFPGPIIDYQTQWASLGKPGGDSRDDRTFLRRKVSNGQTSI